MLSKRVWAFVIGAGIIIAALGGSAGAEVASERVEELFGMDNLVAWCIVPFDGEARGPWERAEMLDRLGFTAMAYDWRDEHLPTFGEELEALEAHDIELTGVWAPSALDGPMETIMEDLERHGVAPALWVMIAEPPGENDAEKVRAAADQLRPVIEEAPGQGLNVGLYNHMGWFGQPENQVAIIQELDMPNVGIVYNQHHGHEHIDRFEELLALMEPHLYAINLNGMVRDGEEQGRKIVPVGHGEREVELALLRTIAESGYSGPIGIIGHTMDDVEERLLDNLEGLAWLKPQLMGEPPGERPTARTYDGD